MRKLYDTHGVMIPLGVVFRVGGRANDSLIAICSGFVPAKVSGLNHCALEPPHSLPASHRYAIIPFETVVLTEIYRTEGSARTCVHHPPPLPRTAQTA